MLDAVSNMSHLGCRLTQVDLFSASDHKAVVVVVTFDVTGETDGYRYMQWPSGDHTCTVPVMT